MLALTRKIGERIKITTQSGETIEIMVGAIRDGLKVRLLFEADRRIMIDRLEVANAKEAGFDDQKAER